MQTNTLTDDAASKRDSWMQSGKGRHTNSGVERIVTITSYFLTLVDSGEGVVHYSGNNTMCWNVVIFIVESEVDGLLVCSSNKNIASVHVTMFKL